MRYYILLPIAFLFVQNILAQSINYETEIQPIFNNSCMPCHQGDNPSGGVNLSSYDPVMASDVIQIGDYENSILWQEISSGDMPNNIANNNMGIADLTNEEITLIENWILDLQCTLILCEPGYQCVLGECVCINDMDNDGICDEDEISIDESHKNQKIIQEFDVLGKDNFMNSKEKITIYLYENGTTKKVKHIVY